MKVNNPYTEMIGMMQEHGSKYNPPSIHLAEVLAPPPDLIIKLGDIQVDKNNILIADYLLKDYKRAYYANGKIQFSDPSCDGATNVVDKHAHKVVSISVDTEDYHIEGTGKEGTNTYLWFKDTLEKGDLLAVMPTDDMQVYIVLARVVKPDAFA